MKPGSYRLISVTIATLILTCSASKSTPSYFGDFCMFSIQCNPKHALICRKGICDCLLPDTMTVHKSRRDCVVLAGEICSLSSIHADSEDKDKLDKDKIHETTQIKKLTCVDHAKCTQDGICLCDRTYFATINGTCSPKKLYGDKCSDPQECREDLELTCNDKVEKCECDGVNSVYDKILGYCATKVGSPCTHIFNQSVILENRCVSNSKCVTNETEKFYTHSTCVCNPKYFANSQGLCEEKRGHDQICSFDKECRDESFSPLHCVSGKCKCKSGASYTNIFNRCRKLIHGTCARDNDCNTFSSCSKSTGLCECHPGFTSGSSGLCFVGHPERSCDENEHRCNSERGLICEDGKCQCEFGEYQYFDVNLERCISYVRGPCGQNTSVTCAPHTECINVSANRYECQCKAGFVIVDRLCQLGYGQRCGAGDVDNLAIAPCFKPGGLYCRRGTCQCRSLQYFDEDMRKCRGLVGSTCEKNERDFCTDGGHCEVLWSARFKNGTRGVCECLPGFVERTNRLCLKIKEEDVFV